MKQKLLIHVGAAKTGTTTVQRYLYENLPGAVTMQSVGQDYVYGTFGSVKNHLPNTRHIVCEELLKPAANRQGDPIVVSLDELLGMPFSNGLFYPTLMRFVEMLQWFQEHDYDVRLLLVVRKPYSFLESWYCQLLKTGYFKGSLVDFVDSMVQRPFSWAWVVECLTQTGAPLTLLPYELLRYDRARYASELNAFFETPDLFTAKTFETVANRNMDDDIYKLMRGISTIDDRELVEKAYFCLLNGLSKDNGAGEHGGRNVAKPTLVSPFIKDAVINLLEPLDQAFAKQYMREDLRAFYG